MEDDCQLSSVLAPVGVAVPDVVTITESIDHGDTWHAILDFGHVFLQSPWHSKVPRLSFPSMVTVEPQQYLDSPAIFHPWVGQNAEQASHFLQVTCSYYNTSMTLCR